MVSGSVAPARPSARQEAAYRVACPGEGLPLTHADLAMPLMSSSVAVNNGPDDLHLILGGIGSCDPLSFRCHRSV